MKFNFISKGKNQVTNYQGAPAYKLAPEWELYAAVVCASLNDKFYETATDSLTRLRELIAKNDHRLTAKLAVYAREQMNLRSIPLVLAVELAKLHTGDSLVSRMTARVIQRADEITELLAYYQLANQRTGTKKLNRLSKQLQLGLQQAFNKFDEYQLAKYNRDADVKLRDALFLVHPKAKDEAQQAIFNRIVEDTLQTPYTWETELSALGQQEFASENEKKQAFARKWEELLDSGKLGYMALLRNLRNMLEAEVSSAHIQNLCDSLASEQKVLRSKQLPFRFLAAYRELSKLSSGYASTVMNALEKAVAVSARNISGFDDNTRVLIACDVSGSMQKPVSRNSKVLLYDIGLMLGMLLKSRCKNVVSGIFGDTWKVVNLPDTGVLSNVDAFYKREGEVGYSTNGYLVVQDLINRKQQVDKVMMFTDCQLWNSRGGQIQLKDVWNSYKAIAPQAKLYLFDLNGYGQVPLSITGNDVHLIAGWSDKIFDILAAIDKGQDALDVISKIEI